MTFSNSFVLSLFVIQKSVKSQYVIFILNKMCRAELGTNNRPLFANQTEEKKVNSYAYLIMSTHSKDYLNSNSKESFSI